MIDILVVIGAKEEADRAIREYEGGYLRWVIRCFVKSCL